MRIGDVSRRRRFRRGESDQRKQPLWYSCYRQARWFTDRTNGLTTLEIISKTADLFRDAVSRGEANIPLYAETGRQRCSRAMRKARIRSRQLTVH